MFSPDETTIKSMIFVGPLSFSRESAPTFNDTSVATAAGKKVKLVLLSCGSFSPIHVQVLVRFYIVVSEF